MRLIFVNTTSDVYECTLPNSQQPQRRVFPPNTVIAVDFEPEDQFNLVFGRVGDNYPCDLGVTFTGDEEGVCMIVARDGEDCTVHTVIENIEDMEAIE